MASMSTPARRLIKILTRRLRSVGRLPHHCTVTFHSRCTGTPITRGGYPCSGSRGQFADRAAYTIWRVDLLEVRSASKAAAVAGANCPLFVPRPSYAGNPTKDCRIGTYRLTDHTVVDIAPSDDDALRWRRFERTSGAVRKAAGDWLSSTRRTGRLDGRVVHFAACATVDISFAGITRHKIDFLVRETIDCHGFKLTQEHPLLRSGDGNRLPPIPISAAWVVSAPPKVYVMRWPRCFDKGF
jgi:hypothetical protein